MTTQRLQTGDKCQGCVRVQKAARGAACTSCGITQAQLLETSLQGCGK